MSNSVKFDQVYLILRLLLKLLNSRTMVRLVTSPHPDNEYLKLNVRVVIPRSPDVDNIKVTDWNY